MYSVQVLVYTQVPWEGAVEMACITLISFNLEESTIHESIAVESDQESVMFLFFRRNLGVLMDLIWGSCWLLAQS